MAGASAGSGGNSAGQGWRKSEGLLPPHPRRRGGGGDDVGRPGSGMTAPPPRPFV